MGKNTSTNSDFIVSIRKQLGHNALQNVREVIEQNIHNNVLVASCKIKYNPPGYESIDETIYPLTGFTVAEYMHNGPALAVHQIVHADIYLNDLLPEFFQIQSKIDDRDLPNWYFASDYAFKKSDGKIVHLHQRLVILERDQQRNILSSYGFITDSSYLNYPQDHIVFTAVSIVDGVVTTNLKKTYTPQVLRFSKREMEILKLMRQGLSSKQMAGQLHISINTINNHRANMLEKANAKNTVELITYVVAQGVLS